MMEGALAAVQQSGRTAQPRRYHSYATSPEESNRKTKSQCSSPRLMRRGFSLTHHRGASPLEPIPSYLPDMASKWGSFGVAEHLISLKTHCHESLFLNTCSKQRYTTQNSYDVHREHRFALHEKLVPALHRSPDLLMRLVPALHRLGSKQILVSKWFLSASGF
jgi:hypothetical protein